MAPLGRKSLRKLNDRHAVRGGSNYRLLTQLLGSIQAILSTWTITQFPVSKQEHVSIQGQGNWRVCGVGGQKEEIAIDLARISMMDV